MAKGIRLTPEQRSNLVAYLDGELDEDATREIDETLLASSVARNDKDMLAATWDMLDLLPRVDVDEQFTDDTITRIVTAQAGPSDAKLWWLHAGRRTGILLVWLAGLTVAGLGGFYGAHAFPNENQQLIEDFPVIKNLDPLRTAGSVEFLEELRRNNLFTGQENETQP